MSESSQSDVAHRAAARKAKILARGNSGLNKLAQTARGDEAETLYGQDSSGEFHISYHLSTIHRRNRTKH